MVNFGLNPASILGLFLAVAGASLYFMRTVRPELSRDHDIFFAAVGLLCGFILLFQGWRLDPILQFGQFLLTGSAVFFAVESIRLRGVATEQARRNTPIVDRDRPVSRTRVYTEAELDKFDSYDDYEGTPNYDSPRLRGYDEPQPRSSRRSERRRTAPAASDMRDEPRSSRSSRNRPPRTERSSSSETDTRSRRRPNSTRDRYDDWREKDEWDDESQFSSPRSRTRPTSRDTFREDNYSEPTRNERKRRPNPSDMGRSYDDEDYDDRDLGRDYDADLGRSYDDDDEISTDYVDYQPLDDSGKDYSDDDRDRNDGNDGRERNSDWEDRPDRKNPLDFDY